MMFVCGACGQSFDRGGYCSTDGQALVATTDPMLGREVGRYRIARLLGEGGMGQVYLGVQPAIGSRVAIKILSNECTRIPELLERFFAEARAVNLIRHESIVSVIDMAQLDDGRPYIVMEFIEGQTLGQVVRSGPAPIGGVVQAMTEVMSALGAAHALGIVHRDLKPDNVLITAEGHAKVLDFGIAKLAPGLSNALSPRTRTGALLGTPAYMAPEQISGAGNVDARTDLYAAGVVLFQAVTGRVPFQGDTLYDLMRAHLEQTPPSPRAMRPELPPALEAVILTALEKDPARRFQSAAEMTHAMHEAARALPVDQWRVLSSRGGMVTGRPSLEHMRHMTPVGAAPAATGQGHAPTVRASEVMPQQRTERDRPRGRGRAIAIVAFAAVCVGVVAIAVSQRGRTAAGVPAPAIATAGSDAAEGLSPPSSGSAPAPTVATPPPTPAPPAGGPPPARAGSGSGGTASPPRGPRAPVPGPTIVGGGSAADHGVHIGSGVQVGPGVVIGGSTATAPSPSTPKEIRRPIDYNPKKFDAAAYAPKALALARQLYPDAGFVRYDMVNVFPDGLASLGLTDDDASFLFRSPSHSARPAGIPKNLDVDIPCYVEVEVGVREVRARVRSMDPIDANCKWPIRPLPTCSPAQVWAKAKAKGADLATVAKVAFLSDGTWFFDNENDGEGFVESYPDRCP
ncbi:MAG: pkn1 [Myxococcales bacterium]|nr:pkn1 [Myxococcales bacterium]